MRIATSQLFTVNARRMGELSADAQRVQSQISSGKRLAAPSDDAVAYQRLTGLRRAGADARADQTNLDLAATLVAQSDSTLASIERQLGRAQEIAIQGASDTLSADQRAALAVALDEIVADLVALANTDDARGVPLFGGTDGGPPFAVTNGVVAYQGTGVPTAIPIGDGVSVAATDTGARLFTDIAVTGGGTTDVFACVTQLAAALRAGTPPGPALDGIKASLDHVAAGRASFGARGARLDLEADRLRTEGTTREIARSGLEDTDIEGATIELMRTMTVLQATQASLGKLTQLSLFDYLR